MNTIQKRFFLFIFGCILTRLIITFIVKNLKSKYLQIAGYIALIPAIGFLTIYFLNLRKTGLETFGDKIWWNDIRIIHGILYLLFAYLAINKNRDSWKILLIDVIFGFIMFLNHHYLIGNFKYLF
jgi:uncharacterized membrane protein (GlpM family)